MMRHDNRLPVSHSRQRLEDIAFRFLKQIDCLLRHEPRSIFLFDHYKVVHVLPGVLHLEKILTKKIGPEGSADEQDPIDVYRFVFQEMNILGQGELGLQLVDTPEEIVVVEKVVSFDIDDGKETLGQETDNLEPGLLTVSEADVAGNQGDGVLVCRQRWHHHFQNAENFVVLPEFSMNIGKRADKHVHSRI